MIHTDKLSKKARDVLEDPNASFRGMGYLIWEKIPSKLLFDESIREVLETNEDITESGETLVIHAFRDTVHEHIDALKKRNISSVRTGVSWAEWDTPGGKEAIKWYIREYHSHGFDILPNLTFTPPSIAVEPQTNAPPKNPMHYANFVHGVCTELGEYFNKVELWNEWNITTDWDRELDKNLEIFTYMIASGALIAQHHNKATVLGGPNKVNDESLRLIAMLHARGLFRLLDVIGFHNLRGTWSDDTPFPPLPEQANSIEKIIAGEESEELVEKLYGSLFLLASDANEQAKNILKEELESKNGIDKPKSFWLTEYGFPTEDPNGDYEEDHLEVIQAALFAYASVLVASGDLDRCYWYTYKDLVSPSLRLVTTGWEDVLQYYYGDTHEDGSPKLLGKLLLDGGIPRVIEYILERDLWHLVDEASLARKIPENYTGH